MTETTKTARLEARVDAGVHAILKRAAEIEGRSLTDFVVSAALDAARNTVERAEVLTLSRDSASLIASLVLEPPAVAPAMDRAAERHKTLIGPI